MCLVETTTTTTTFTILGDFSSKFPTIHCSLVLPKTDVSCSQREDLKAGIYREDGLGDGGGAESSLPISDHQPPCLTSLQKRGPQSILCECRRAVATTCPGITSIIITTVLTSTFGFQSCQIGHHDSISMKFKLSEKSDRSKFSPPLHV